MRRHVIVLVLLPLLLAVSRSAKAHDCDGTVGAQADKDQCLAMFFDEAVRDAKAARLKITGLTCAEVKPTFAAKVGNTDTRAFEVTCQQEDTIVTLPDPKKLRTHQSERLTLSIGTFASTAVIPEFAPAVTEEQDPEEDDATGGPPQKAPIDIAPAVPPWAKEPCSHPEKKRFLESSGAKLILVYENLSVDPCSASYVTESDRVVVRVVARKVTLCRYSVTADDANKNEADVARIGGLEAFTELTKNWGFTSQEDEPKVASCGYALEQKDGRYVAAAPEANEPASVDFTLGPYTSGELKFHVSRQDREFRTKDLEGAVTIANHLRYAGWVDLVALAANSNRVDLSVRADNGSELQRVHETESGFEIDYMAAFKVFAWCSGDGNGFFKAQDMTEAGACLGLGAGFSLRHLKTRFYPIGLNLTVQKYFSIHGMLMLDQGEELTSGLSEGDLFSGTTSDLPTRDRLYAGFAIGVGFDPSLVGALVGAIIKSGL